MTKNFFYTVLLSVVNLLFQLASFPFAFRILGPEGIGSVQIAISLAQYFALFAALGIPVYGITEIARHRDNPKQLAQSFSELSIIYLVASLAISIIYFSLIYSIPYFQHNSRLFLLAGSLVFMGFTQTEWFFSGLELFKSITIRTVIVKLLSLLLLFYFVHNKSDNEKYLLIVIFSLLGNQIFSLFMCLRKTSFTLKNINMKRHLKPLLFLFSTTIISSTYTILDTVLLGFLADEHAVGLYTASIKVVKLSLPVVTAMGVILIPSITKYFHQNDTTRVTELLDKSFRFIIFFSIPLCTGMILFAPECILLFSGKDFYEAVPVMRIVSLLPIIIGLGHFYSIQILLPLGKTKQIFYSVMIGSFSFLLLNWILVPSLQSMGSAIANVVSEGIVTICYIYFMGQFFSLKSNWSYVWQSLISTIIFIPIHMFFRYWELPIWLLVILSGTTCILAFFAIQWLIFKNYFVLDFIEPVKKWIYVKQERSNSDL